MSMTKIQSTIADYLNVKRVFDNGNFAVDSAKALSRLKVWNVEAILKALERVRTGIFKKNIGSSKRDFLERLADHIFTRIPKLMPQDSNDRKPIDQSVHFHAPVTAEVIQTGQKATTTINKFSETFRAECVDVRYLDAFKIIDTNTNNVGAIPSLPLTAPEVSIRKEFEIILGEPFHAKDSGIETCDTFSLQALHDGKQCGLAAMFKGAGNTGLKWPLQVAGCGKNGNQIVRLFEVPADLYLIQANGPFDPTLIKHIKDTADAHSIRSNKSIKYMLVDGATTYKLLKASNSKLV